MPTPEGAQVLEPFSRLRPFTVHSDQVFVHSGARDARVLAVVGLPFTDPRSSRYASVLTDPMGRLTTYPALIERQVGRGRVLFASGPIEAETATEQRDVFARLVGSMFEPTLTAIAPPCIEVTAFSRSDLGATMLFFFNSQASAPPVPVHGVRVSMAGSRQPAEISVLPQGETLQWEKGPENIEFVLPICETLAVVRIDW